jgi:hypothetical protein
MALVRPSEALDAARDARTLALAVHGPDHPQIALHDALIRMLEAPSR